MAKLTAQQRQKLRLTIREKIESEEGFQRGEQTTLARRYKVSRSYVQQIVHDERARFRNPVHWEWQFRQKRGQKVNLIGLVEEFKDHPAFRNTNPSS